MSLPAIKPPSFLDALKTYHDDFPLYARDVLRIQSDHSEGKREHSDETRVIPFVLSRAQERIWKSIDTKLKANKPVRIIVLKERQAGISTLFRGINHWWVTTRKHQGSILLTHNQKSSENLFQKDKTFFIYSPPQFQPMVRIFNRQKIHYANPDPKSERKGLDSTIINDTVGDINVGASFTLHFAHFSEASRYEGVGCNVEGLMESLLPTIPYKSGTFVVFESTAEEGGEYFKNKFMNKKDSYEKIFLSWLSDETYTIPLESSEEYFELGKQEDQQFGDEYTEAENIKRELLVWYPELKDNLQDLKHETYCRLAWRRRMIMDDTCHGDVNVFRRVYPTTPEDAFRGNTVGVFPAWVLASYKEKAESVSPELIIKRGFNEYAYNDGVPEWWKDVFIEEFTDKGILQIHEEPIPEIHYYIGADPSFGLADGDKSGAIVLRGTNPCVEVATWNHSIRPDEFAVLLYALGAHFNWALIGVETNSMGYDTFVRLLRDMAYPMVYRREAVNDKLVTDVTDYFGWYSTDRSKFQMISDMRRALANREVIFKDLETINEFAKYQKMANGKLGIPDGTAKGKSANLVMAGCIALQMTKQIHLTGGESVKEPVRFSLAWAEKRIKQLQTPHPFRQRGAVGLRRTFR